MESAFCSAHFAAVRPMLAFLKNLQMVWGLKNLSYAQTGLIKRHGRLTCPGTADLSSSAAETCLIRPRPKFGCCPLALGKKRVCLYARPRPLTPNSLQAEDGWHILHWNPAAPRCTSFPSMRTKS